MTSDQGIPPAGPAGPRSPEGAPPRFGPYRSEEVALLDYLRRNPDLAREADMYESALQIASAATIIDWMALAAHDVREMMDRLPHRLQGKPLPDHNALRNRVQNFRDHHWGAALSLLEAEGRTQCVALVRKASKFFDQFDREFPKKRAVFAAAQEAVGVMPSLLPPKMQEEVETEWVRLSKHFIDICHHNATDTPERFREHMLRFARFTLDRLAPPIAAVEDLDRLDAVIREYE